MLVAIWIYLLIQTIGYCWVIFKKLYCTLFYVFLIT